MDKKLILLAVIVLVLGLADGASAVYLAVDIVCPIRGEDPNYVIRNERTSKGGGYLAWGHGWGDLSRHDGAALNNADGSGVNIYMSIGYEGDMSLKVLGLTFIGDGQDCTGLPVEGSGPIANSYLISHRHWGGDPYDPNEGQYGDGSMYIRFSGGGLVVGDYSLTTYHNCPNNAPWDMNSPAYPPDWHVDEGDDSIMPTVNVYGPGVIQEHDGETYDVNVAIQHVTDDESLIPSKVKWSYNGSGDVTVVFRAAPGSDYRIGGAGVVNAFILEGGDPGMATNPRPTGGATEVHPDVILLWKAGLYAAKHDVYFSADFNDVNDSNSTALVSDDQEPSEYDPAGSLTLGEKYYWRIDEVNVAHPNSPWPGAIWNFTVEDGKATKPRVGHGDLPQDVNLAWTPGKFAVTHDLYFGTDKDDVKDANTSSPEFINNFPLDSNSYEIPYLLELGESYYWRVDEHNSVYGTAKGDVWSVGVRNYLVIDDFQSYNLVDNPITNTWLDGMRDLPGPPYFEVVNGAILFLGTAYEEQGEEQRDPVHDGNQSMYFAYDNTGTWSGDVPYYSEAELGFDPTRDLTEYGIKALVLQFYGDPNADANVPYNQMYLTLGDGSGNVASIDYGHYPEQDANDLNEDEWHEWNLDLEDFNDAGVNIDDVNKLIIGFGIPGSEAPNTPGGLGEIFFDGIRLYLSRCVHAIAKPPMDITEDCKVNMADVAVLGGDWLLYDFTVTPEAPPTGPILRYQFNETSGVTAYDMAGSYDGTGKKRNAGDTDWEDFVPLWDPNGKYGGCVNIDEDPVSDDDYFIQVPSAALTDNITDALTISVWLKWESGSDVLFSVYGGTGAGYNHLLGAEVRGDEEFVGGSINDTSAGASGETELWVATDWNHFGYVKDADAKYMAFYINGTLMGENDEATARNIFANLEPWPNDQVRIGSSAERPAGFDDTYKGLVDDFRIYDYGLSQAQVAYIVQGDAATTPLYVPLESDADVYDEEPANSKAVNFRDFALIVQDWLDELMWP
ncbi:MAG: LamG domain-containing protein [Planctomycetota bacterium]|jgi:hypothetical protein